MRVIIDTDPGMGTIGSDPEDGLAILLALEAPEVTVAGITLVQGNVPVSQSWRNANHLLALAGRTDVAVAIGAAEPLASDRSMQQAWLVERELLVQSVPEIDVPDDTGSAAEFIRETVMDSPGEITVVAIGPLTNVARALKLEPAIAEAVAGLVIMGGTVEVPGNITPAAEFNLWMDPDAGDTVFESGAPITMVGLDVCHQTHLDREQIAGVRTAGSDLATFVADASEAWINVREQIFGDADLHLYDSLAVAAAIDPAIVETRPALIEVETSDGPAEGMTVAWTNEILRAALTGREPNAQVAVGIDTDRFEALFTRLVIERLERT